jgi:hypothetical protein
MRSTRVRSVSGAERRWLKVFRTLNEFQARLFATKTRAGLQVKAVLDTNEYDPGIKVSDKQFTEVKLRRQRVHPAWNYTISPRRRT